MSHRLRKPQAAPEKGAALLFDEKVRLDKWLFYARFFKSRGLAAGAISANAVRVNGAHAGRAAKLVGAGDVLTFVMGGEARVVRVLACGARRGSQLQARALYTWISEEPEDWVRADWEAAD